MDTTPHPTFSNAPQPAGHLLVQCLIAQGATHAFGVPGESYLAVLDGFHDLRDHIQFVVCRQEGGAAFMADAHGKLSGRPGLCFVTRGPGATNASIGIHTAFQDSTPMIVFIGDVASDTRDREAFQEVNFQVMFGPSTGAFAKRVERIDDPRRIPEYVARAYATALSGRPGPVVLVLPEDMLTQTVQAAPLPRVEAPRGAVAAQDLARLHTLLQQAKQPFVIAGGPGWTPAGGAALQRFAEHWHLPVGNAFRFQDTFDNAHPLYAGDVGIGINPALAERIKNADLLIAIGPRLGEMTTSGYTLVQSPAPTQTLVHVHPSGDELGRVFHTALPIACNVSDAAEAFAAITPPNDVPWRAWSDAAHADYEANLQPPTLPELQHDNARGLVDMAQVIASIGRHLPPDAVLTNGAGNFASWLHRYHRYAGLARGHKTQLAPTNGAMGYGVPAGIAANLVTGRTVFTIAGDGDFLMNGQELATATLHGAKSIIVLLNNGMYGTIRMHQEREYPAHVAGTHLANPHFADLARAYGWAGVRITRTDEFEPQLLAALARPEGTLIEIMLDPEVITPRTTLARLRATALNAQNG